MTDDNESQNTETQVHVLAPLKEIHRPIEQEMKKSYIDYAMSVIVGRALPDVQGRSQAGAPAHSVRDVRPGDGLQQAP